MIAILLFGLLVGLPIVEILVFVEIGSRIGSWMTASATMLTAILGLALFRIQRRRMASRAQVSVDHALSIISETINRLGLQLAALLLFLPGFVTDAFGFLLSIPVLRVWIMMLLLQQLRNVIRIYGRSSFWTGRPSPTIHEAEYSYVDDNDDSAPAISCGRHTDADGPRDPSDER